MTWGEKWALKTIIYRDIGRFPKWEFDTMLVNMSPRAAHIRKESKVIKIMSVDGSGESPPEMTIPSIGALLTRCTNRATLIQITIISTYV